jgi:hypothetical protein
MVRSYEPPQASRVVIDVFVLFSGISYDLILNQRHIDSALVSHRSAPSFSVKTYYRTEIYCLVVNKLRFTSTWLKVFHTFSESISIV